MIICLFSPFPVRCHSHDYEYCYQNLIRCSKDFHLQIGERLVARYAIFTTGYFFTTHRIPYDSDDSPLAASLEKKGSRLMQSVSSKSRLKNPSLIGLSFPTM